MNYQLNSTSQSITLSVFDDTGTPVTGLVAATMPTISWSLPGAASTNTIALSDLSTITAAWASGGVKERTTGRYRLDVPDAMFTVAGEVAIWGEATNKRVLAPWVDVATSTDPLTNQVPGSYAVGSAGYALGRIGTGQIVTTSLISQTGTVGPIYIGDDYLLADGRQLDFTDTSNLWPNLTGATISMRIDTVGLNNANVNLTAFAGSVVTAPGPNEKVRVQLTKAQTNTLTAGNLLYYIVATLANADVVTLVSGRFQVYAR